MSNNQMAAAMVARGINVKWLRSIENEPKPVKGAGMPPGMVTVNHQGGPSPSGGGRNWVHFPVYFRSALHTYLSSQIHLLLYLGISGTPVVNRLMLILYGSARLLPERVRSKHDLKPSLADLRPMFLQDRNLCRSSLHVGWPGGPGRSLILEQICSGLLKAPLLQGRGSLQSYPWRESSAGQGERRGPGQPCGSPDRITIE